MNPPAQPDSFLARFARPVLFRLFNRIQRGELTVHAGGSTRHFGRPAPGEPSAELRVENGEFFADTLFGGSIGLAEAYIKGIWHTPDLTALIRLGQRNRELADGLDTGWSWLVGTLRDTLAFLRRNTLCGSRRNILAHYDLSNEFFQLLLDPTMMYSCAIFEREGMSLEEASIAKNDRICRKLGLKPEDHLLEIGTGWGGFAIHAASHYGCRVTTTTISDAQFEMARQRIREARLENRITLLKEDYRKLQGQFDKLVSIEMIEAVGHQFYPAYFAACSRLLAPDGLMLLQTITIDDRRYEKAKRSVDFIQRYIFPGGCLPSVTAVADAIRDHTNLRLTHFEDITEFYPPTLRAWHRRMTENREPIKALGFDEPFLRMWEFYFAYCEAGFLERWIGNVQMLFAKPDCRAPAILGQL